MKKSSPGSKHASPVGGASSANMAMTSLSTASGTYKLAAMKRDNNKGNGSPGTSSNNNSPRPEPATVWKKPDDSQHAHSIGSGNDSNSGSPSLPSAQINVPQQESHEHDDIGEQTAAELEEKPNTESKSEKPLPTRKNTKEMSEEELLKSGIHLTQRMTTAASQRTFNWDDEDDEDGDWTQSLPLPDVKKPKESTTQRQQDSKANEISSSSPSIKKEEPQLPKTAPWVNATLHKPDAVPISQQIKELSQQKQYQQQTRGGLGRHGNYPSPHYRQQPPPPSSDMHTQHHHHEPIHVGNNVPRYNYRLPQNHDVDGSGENPDNEEHRGRYKYPNYEKRYRSDVPPPRQELYNANSGAVEPAWRRRGSSSYNRRSSEREPAKRDAPPDPDPVPEPEPQPEPEPVKSREEVLKGQADFMKEAREKARRRKEEELRLEEERKSGAKKKADDLAARIAEKERKQKEEEEEKKRKLKEQRQEEERQRKEKEEEEKRKKREQQEQEEKIAAANERGRRNEPGNLRSHRSKSSIDENQALRTASSVLDEDENKNGSSKPKLWTKVASSGRDGKLWSEHHKHSASRHNNTSNDLWVPGESDSSTTGLLSTKDDLVLIQKGSNNQRHHHHHHHQGEEEPGPADISTNWRRRALSPPSAEKRPSKDITNKAPGTPSKGGNNNGSNSSPDTTPNNNLRGISRFFPSSSQVENNNNTKSSPWNNASPKTMLLHRETLFGNNSHHHKSTPPYTNIPPPPLQQPPQFVSDNHHQDEKSNEQPQPVSRPRVLLPTGENKSNSINNNNSVSRLPSLDSIQALQSTIAERLVGGGKKNRASNNNNDNSAVGFNTLPIPETPMIKSIEESNIPFPPLAREEKLRKMMIQKEDKKTKQMLQTQSNLIEQEEEQHEIIARLPKHEEGEEENGHNINWNNKSEEPTSDSLRYVDKEGRQNQREYIVDVKHPAKINQVKIPGKVAISVNGGGEDNKKKPSNSRKRGLNSRRKWPSSRFHNNKHSKGLLG